MAHGLLIVKALIPVEKIVDILDPVLSCVDSIDARHREGRHAHLQEFVLVQEECLLAVQGHLRRTSGFLSNLRVANQGETYG